ncbi:MAG: hypothetical protein ACRBDL_02515 [Alphaproteobacteria bacterium]
MKKLFLICVIGYAVFYFWGQEGGGVLSIDPASSTSHKVWQEPKQKNLSGRSQKPFKSGHLKLLAEYEITARVLASKYYSDGKNATIAPLDLAVGWGQMADPGVYNRIQITQSNRFYRWWTSKYPIPRRNIESKSVNMHIIPANAEIAKKLKSAKKHKILTMKGYLVHYREGNSRNWWEWKSSMVRTDTGDGACELMYVEDIVLY